MSLRAEVVTLDDGRGAEVGRVGSSRLVAAAHDSEDGRSAASGKGRY